MHTVEADNTPSATIIFTQQLDIFITEKGLPLASHTRAVYFLLLSCRLLAVATGLEDDSPVFGVPAEKRGPLAGVGVPNTPAGLPKAPVDPAAKLNALLDG